MYTEETPPDRASRQDDVFGSIPPEMIPVTAYP